MLLFANKRRVVCGRYTFGRRPLQSCVTTIKKGFTQSNQKVYPQYNCLFFKWVPEKNTTKPLCKSFGGIFADTLFIQLRIQYMQLRLKPAVFVCPLFDTLVAWNGTKMRVVFQKEFLPRHMISLCGFHYIYRCGS